MKILNMGSGYNPIKGAVNLDINPACNPDVVHDLEKPLPFPEIAAYFNRLEESIPKINLGYLFPK